MSVTMDAAANQVPGGVGVYSWGGMASTVFWNDPQEQMTVLFLTQLVPSSKYPIRRQLKVLTQAAIEV